MKGILAVTVAIMLMGLITSASAVVTERVSVNSFGVPSDGACFGPTISADGRYVCYTSAPPGIVSGDFDGVWEVFVFDRVTGTRTLASASAAGEPANDFSIGSISANGRYVALASYATNLVPGITNGECQFYRKDLQTGAIMCVSTSSAGQPGNKGIERYDVAMPSLSATGRYVAFSTEASNLVNGDTNGREDCFTKDCDTGEIWRVSTTTGGGQLWEGAWAPEISPDGRCVAFETGATEISPGGHVYLFVKDRQTNATTCVSVSSGGAYANAESETEGLLVFTDDNRFAVFESDASNLVAGDTNGVRDVFVRDRTAGTTIRVSTSSSGAQANGGSFISSISADGNYVTFSSDATNLVQGDTNGSTDVFTKNLVTGETRLVSVVTGGGQKPASGEFHCAGIFDGRYCVWNSEADGIVPGPKGGPIHVYVSDFLADPIADAKSKADDDPVIVSGGVVTSALSGAFYFQQDGIASPDRVCGIRVAWNDTVAEGQRYIVTGTMKTNLDGERYIEATAVDPHTSEWTTDAKPLSMPNKSLGGGNRNYNSSTGAGQIGVTGGAGLNNIGLLVRTTGSCTYVDAHTFTIDDGSGLSVTCVTPSTILASTAWQQVAVTGISSLEKTGETYTRLLRVTGVDVITSAPPVGVTGRWESTGADAPWPGVFGMLLTQQGSTVSGGFLGGLTDGLVIGNLFTATVLVDPDGYNETLSLYFTVDGDTMSGTMTNVSDDYTVPFTFHRLSTDPVSPFVGRPKVVSATCNGSSIDITWDRPVFGWDYDIIDDNGYSIAQTWDLNTSYNSITHIYHIALAPSTPWVAHAHYTIHLEDNSTPEIDWHDPYGVAAWDDPADCYKFSYTRP